MLYHKVSRRLFLQGIGGATLILPALPSLISRFSKSAAAAAGDPIFIGISHPQNYPAKIWSRPLDAQTAFQLDTGKTAYHSPLGSLLRVGAPGPLNIPEPGVPSLSSVFPSDLNSFLNRFSVVAGSQHFHYGSHGGNNANAIRLGSNYNNGFRSGNFDLAQMPTIDTIMAYHKPAPLGQLVIATNGDSLTIRYADEQRMVDPSRSITTEPVTPLRRPQEVYNQIFGASSGGGGTSPLGILDRVLEDLRAVRNGLPAEEKPVLEAHEDQLRDLETRLNIAGGCSGATDPGYYAHIGNLSNAERIAYHEAINTLIALAVQCELVRTISLNVGFVDATISASLHHDSAHNTSNTAANGFYEGNDVCMRSSRWVMKYIIADLFQKLSTPTSGGGTLFDNVVGLITTETDAGPIAHEGIDQMLLLFGSCLETGQYFDLADRSTRGQYLLKGSGNAGHIAFGGANEQLPGPGYSRILATLLNVMGIAPAQSTFYDVNGSPIEGLTGPGPDYNPHWRAIYRQLCDEQRAFLANPISQLIA